MDAPAPDDYPACIAWQALHSRLNTRAEEQLLASLGGRFTFIDIEAEEAARNSPSPSVRKAFKAWHETERALWQACNLLKTAEDMQFEKAMGPFYHLDE